MVLARRESSSYPWPKGLRSPLLRVSRLSECAHWNSIARLNCPAVLEKTANVS